MSDEFHVNDVALRAYTEDRLVDVDAWSVEAHLERCRACQDRIVLHGPVADAVAAARISVRESVSLARRPGRWRRVMVLIGVGPAARTAWLISLAVTVSLAVALVVNPLLMPSWVLLLLAPVVPVLGIVGSYGPYTDPLHELVAATPYSGLRIVLWRTISALAATIPVALVCGVVADIGTPVMWLLPCLALTCLTLALGCLMDIARAGIVVATAWVVLVLAPLKDAAVIAPSTTAVWLLVTAAAMALMLVRRDRMGRGVAR
jgi:hypothetical protein